MNGKKDNLLKLRDELSTKKGKKDYNIPGLWYSAIDKPTKETYNVNPYAFYSEVIDKIISLEEPFTDKKDWIKDAVLYSMMIRTSTAWNHNHEHLINIFDTHYVETGTFVKTLALLPVLKNMGITAIYMLPIFSYSRKYKKGELGSPYAVYDMFKIDDDLRDPLSALTIDEQFSCFVEAAHLLNMHVIIDFIPRTMALDNNLLLEHPEWFYWIYCDKTDVYKVPIIPNIPICQPALYHAMKYVYQNVGTKAFLKYFSVNPKELNGQLFEELKERAIKENLSLLDLIEENYGITVARAFSDNINDHQPVWNDVTFFRYYFDHPTKTASLHEDDLPPYVLYDTIKCNLYQGEKPNTELFDLISNVLPYYQTNFSIDGARIDMGHALPKELNKLIFDKAKKVNKNFCFIAEVLDPNNVEYALENGYDCIIGDGFVKETRPFSPSIKKFLQNSTNLALPIFASAESHDTPRLVSRNGKPFAKAITLLNMFMPNGIPFINSGQEFYELQPMNTGLDSHRISSLVLEKSDPYYGKLALFDRYVFHYTQEDDLINALIEVAKIRKDYAKFLSKDNYINIDLGENIISFVYKVDTTYLTIVANLSNDAVCLPIIIENSDLVDGAECLFSTDKCEFNDEITLLPFQFSILMKKE